MKKFFAAIIFSVSLMINFSAQAAADDPKVLADSAILVEASTGRIIWEKNSNAEREPASMTKMLTCVLALEKLDPLEETVMSQAAVNAEDNTLSWSTNDLVSVRDMITAVMLVSENGGAIALAQAVSGSTESFANLMNDKARSIGCKNSHFANPNGLPNPNHYSTAADMARIAVYCMKNVDFRKIVETRRTSIHWIQPKEKWSELNNTNELLGKYKGANGIKTGWTRAAGGCLAACSPDHDTRFDDAANLLNYGFERVRMVDGINKELTEKKVFVRGGKKATVRVAVNESLNFPLMAGEDSKLLKVTYDLPRVVDEPVARLPLVAREDVAEGFSFGSLLVRIVAPLIS